MSTIQAKIAAKKLTEEAGVPDSLCDQMFNLQSGHWVAIVDLAHLDRTEGREGSHVVRLEIGQLEIMTGAQADHCRELMRAVYLARQPRGLDQVDQHEETPDDITARGERALMLCESCGHMLGDDRIKHEESDADGWCTWESDGTEVEPGKDPDTQPPVDHTSILEEAASELLPTP